MTIGTVPEAFEHATLGRVGLDIMYLQTLTDRRWRGALASTADE